MLRSKPIDTIMGLNVSFNQRSCLLDSGQC